MSESTQPKTRIEIIDHVVNHFNTNPRSIGTYGFCRYNGPNGEHCAFAILCSNPKELPEGNINLGIAKLLPEFAGHPEDFYSDIQMLHDEKSYWTKTSEGNKLTQKGIKEVKRLKDFHG